MSAPDTNIKVQERQHKAPLSGMALAVGFGVLLIAFLGGYLMVTGNEPGEADVAPAATMSTTEKADPAVTQDPVSGIVNPGAPEAAGASE